jgi:predicted GIY-YIG superfamily endonuclease
LVYVEEVADRSAAQKRELEIKHLKHPKKIALVSDASRNILPSLRSKTEEEPAS